MKIVKHLIAFFALAAVAHATTVLNESDSGTPTFPADYTVNFNNVAPSPCSGQTQSLNSQQSCNLPANFSLSNGVTVSGTGPMQIGTGQWYGLPAGSPMAQSDYLIHVNQGQSITFNFSSAAQAAGLLIDTDLGGDGLTFDGLTYHHPGGSNFAYFLGFTDDTQSTMSLTIAATGNGGFLIDALKVQNADPLAPTADASTMVMIGTGLSLLGWMRRRRSAAGFDMKPFRENGLFRPEHDISDDDNFVEIHAERN